MAKIKVTMHQSYNNIVLGFRSCTEAGKFMDSMVDAAAKVGQEISFTVKTEEKAPETDEAAREAGDNG